MSKRIEITGEQLEKVLGREGRIKMEALNEEMSGLGRQIAHDQQAWLDSCMKDILPPHLYEAARRQENLEELSAYVAKNGIRIVYLPDTLRMRVELRGRIYGEWKANLTVDGEPVNFTPQPPPENNGVDSSSLQE